VRGNKLAGDSAGGNLVATCLMALRDCNQPLPAGNVQISPWITIENSQSSRKGVVYQDCLTFDMLSKAHGTYFLPQGATTLSEEDERVAMRNPAISPLYGSFVGFCPTLVTYGGTEIFQHDVQELIDCLNRDGVKVDLITRRHAPHIWIISSILSPTHDLWKKDCALLADWCANVVSAEFLAPPHVHVVNK
jgi:acetyl esterase/lipase